MKLFEMHNSDGFFMARLHIPQAAPSKWAFLVAGTWAAYGGYYMTVSCPMFQFSFTIPKVYKGMVEFNKYRVKKELNLFLMKFKRTPVYANWRCYYRVDHVEEWGCCKFANGLEAVKWAKNNDEDDDSETSFGYSWGTADDYAGYEAAQRREKETGYRQLSRDYGMEAFENSDEEYLL